MIKEIRITNLEGFKNGLISFEANSSTDQTIVKENGGLLNIQAIIGSNRSGKSTLIDYLYGVSTFMLNDKDIRDLWTPHDSTKAIEVEILFVLDKVTYSYHVGFYDYGLKFEILSEVLDYEDYHTLLENDSIEYDESMLKYISDYENLSHIQEYLLNDMNFNGLTERGSCITDKNHLYYIDDPDDLEHKAFMELVKGLDIGIYSHFDIVDILRKGGNRKHILDLASYVTIALSRGTILLVDDIDLGICPMIVEHLVSLFRDRVMNTNKAQIIFTTSNPYFLGELLKRDEVNLLERDHRTISTNPLVEKFSYIDMYRVDAFDDLPKDAKLDIWYRNGRLGATPVFNHIDFGEAIQDMPSYSWLEDE